MFSQTSHVGGVGSGAGALRVGKGADQTGNLLELMNTAILTPQLDVGMKLHAGPGGVRKKRFGAQGVNHMYDYPQHPVKGTGNGQAYQMSKAGYLPGNGGGGTAGYGCHDPHNYGFNEEADLTEAKAIAMRETDVQPHFVQPSHMQYVDRTKQTIVERFQEQAEDYQRLRIKDMMSKGFTEEEITKKVEAERSRAIMNAEKHPLNTTALMEAKLAGMLPTRLNEDFPTSVAPGGIARRQDATAVERALNVGNPVAFKKKAEAMRHEQRLRGEVQLVEPAQPRQPVSFKEMMADVVKESQTEVAAQHQHETEVEGKKIAVQMSKEDAMEHQKASLMKAMAEKMGTERFPIDASQLVMDARGYKSKGRALGSISESAYEGPSRPPRGPYRPREAKPLAGSTAGDTAAAVAEALTKPRTIREFFAMGKAMKE